MIYHIALSAEHLDLIIRAVGKLEYEQAFELMDVVRVQIHQQNAAEMERLAALEAQGQREKKAGHANGVNLEGEPEITIVEVGTVN